MGHFIEEILREAIYNEKKSHDFCHLAATLVTDKRTKEIFSQLADEEFEHARSFFVLYTGSEFASTDLLYKHHRSEDPIFDQLLQAVETDDRERRALEIALSGEKWCIDRYSVLARTVREPKYRAAFIEALDRSRMQYEVIEEEYRRLMGAAGSAWTTA
ncbi:hypothetical protein LPW11_18875 [Geomonas sp. RF6]|uniref:ferritin family protein n=1 Tax=Geomonas sp. RF6 TaxID=2897342 RepID=UPI001E5BEABB|nr:ferritin family protein [Geomonas sp. RF6]UFS69935.1 hypothetical protein LPW11_18875 [Geomonas sp. RF6]